MADLRRTARKLPNRKFPVCGAVKVPHMARFANGTWIIISLLILVMGCDNTSGTSPSESAEPRTLEAATAAVQEWSDRRQSDDYAGMWLMFTKQIRDGISQEDYVKLSQTCASAFQKMPVTVTGVRLDGPDRAIIRLKSLGIPVQIDAAYEDGKWALPPDDKFAAELGKSVDEIIAARKASGRCGDPQFSQSVSPPPTSTANPSSTTTPEAPGGQLVDPCPIPGAVPHGGPCRAPSASGKQEPSDSPTSTGDGTGACSVDDPGCQLYSECHPMVTGKVDCFPEDESCSKPGNTFPWCAAPATTAGPARLRSSAG